MSALFKSKVGWLLAGTYLWMVLSSLLYLFLINKHNVLIHILLIILTAPWKYFFLETLPVKLGIVTFEIGRAHV